MSSKNMFCIEDSDFGNSEGMAFEKEKLVYNVTEDILILLEDLGISKKELAKRLGKTPAYISQILSGSRNMTLGTLSNICFVLGVRPEVKLPVKEKLNSIEASEENQIGILQMSNFYENVSTVHHHSSNIFDNHQHECWIKNENYVVLNSHDSFGKSVSYRKKSCVASISDADTLFMSFNHLKAFKYEQVA